MTTKRRLPVVSEYGESWLGVQRPAKVRSLGSFGDATLDIICATFLEIGFFLFARRSAATEAVLVEDAPRLVEVPMLRGLAGAEQPSDTSGTKSWPQRRELPSRRSLGLPATTLCRSCRRPRTASQCWNTCTSCPGLRDTGHTSNTSWNQALISAQSSGGILAKDSACSLTSVSSSRLTPPTAASSKLRQRPAALRIRMFTTWSCCLVSMGWALCGPASRK
mmetsp:Transcript_45042/g.80567  ORF Transcript_45042/g.80567 Transcript_45042/m.80567 type:complete len:221 (+) Transcript_45042:1673-2335(+)